MPTFVTKEQFSCGHGLEICHRRTGNDKFVITETLPIPIRCLSCICQELLDASVADGIPPRMVRSRVVELNMHFQALNHGDMVPARQLRVVKRQVLMPESVEEFRAAVLGLAGVPEIKARFLTGCSLDGGVKTGGSGKGRGKSSA
ncbi:hypothetical protein SLS62_002931 [Diatrype stigma]|uniref:Uncharacterized protein n=1 Tax=Diatrype stigma TaxID=117547 RepID=A0AAN9UX03_9PEZI